MIIATLIVGGLATKVDYASGSDPRFVTTGGQEHLVLTTLEDTAHCAPDSSLIVHDQYPFVHRIAMTHSRDVHTHH